MIRHDIVIQGKQLAYWEDRPKKANAVVLIHGLGGDHRGLIALADKLADYRVIVPDLPGYGFSHPLDNTHDYRNYAEFLAQFLAKLHVKKISIVGHSFGCGIAEAIAQLHPEIVQKLILINPVIKNTKSVTLKLSNAYINFAIISPVWLARLLLTSKAAVYLSDRAILTTKDRRLRRQILQEDYDNYARASFRTLQESLWTATNVPQIEPLRKMPVETVLVACRHDMWTHRNTVESLVGRNPSLHVRWKEGGHLFPLEHPDVAAGSFLDTL